MRKGRRRPRPIRARWRGRTRSTTPPSAAPACCACSISTSSSRPPRRSAGRSRFLASRLAVLTNGGGIGVLAVDRLIDLGGTLAALSDKTRAALDAILPPTWSHANPIDIVGDADPARYAGALEALLADPENDAVLILNVPTAIAGASDVAAAMVEVVRRDRARGYRQKPVFAAWIGEDPDSARVFEEARIPHFATEADAVRGFMQLVRYREAQDQLMETPDNLPHDFVPDTEAARAVVEHVLGAEPPLARSARGQRAPAGLRHPDRAGHSCDDAG